MRGQTAHMAMVLVLGLSLASCSHPIEGSSSTATTAVEESNANSEQLIREAIVHAQEAQRYGTTGQPQELVTHAEAALSFAQKAQQSTPNRQHLREATEALGQAIEEGRKGDAAVAARWVHRATLELLQAEDVKSSSPPKGSAGRRD